MAWGAGLIQLAPAGWAGEALATLTQEAGATLPTVSAPGDRVQLEAPWVVSPV